MPARADDDALLFSVRLGLPVRTGMHLRRGAGSSDAAHVLKSPFLPACRKTRKQENNRISLALVHSRARAGVQAPAVRVEVHLSGGLPVTTIVGLPETAVRDLRERVRAALLCAQFEYLH